MTIVTTERLSLRPLLAADAEDYAAMRFHPEVARWLPPAPGTGQEGDFVALAHAAIERFAVSWQERRYAPWGVFHDGRLIGHAGLNFIEQFDGVEVLWSLHPEAQGKGYATEAARAALAYGFETLELDHVFAITLEENRASRAVMERIGLTYRKRVDYKGFTDIVWYDVERATYAERMSSAAR
ncbi:MAG: N-acetyltransferase [Reyranella sp.]|uniref:GNAT family N-acetyltransferase n=1 Tax=Reyranella sp. TaxID=1929291 RepID=UPI0012245C40|nr:GNAT family N-acetyltransferase [Reyranella sp.]TAJ96753.1 MAG: N-acetyltransferase [Reyranella sp.]TBR29827.1 MAG: N-acetyltransferase [Reyranella sp.]